VQAGSALLHESDVRAWGSLTIRAVAERAGVNERTVYRHFGNEQALRHSVMRQLEAEAGVALEGMQLGDVAGQAVRIFRHVASYRMGAGPPLDPTLADTRRRVHEALLDAVGRAAPQWSPEDRTVAAAVLDLLWSVGAYERLVRDWGFETDQAAQAVAWAIAVVADAVGGDRAPGATGAGCTRGLRHGRPVAEP